MVAKQKQTLDEFEGMQNGFLSSPGSGDIINQHLRMTVTDDGVTIILFSPKSMQAIPVFTRDPDAIKLLRELLFQQHVLALSYRPAVPEPFRWPDGRTPKGMETCCVCDGQAESTDRDGNLITCENCHGFGFVPEGGLGERNAGSFVD